jgi:uncharacterized protein YbjT (DUF2867 family)
MPVIVVGADTPTGVAIVIALLRGGGEIRAFVTSPVVGATLRAEGATVAIGDLSDGSHIGAAAHRAFTGVLVESAATDGRPFAFATDTSVVLRTWTTALREASVQRAIWVGDPAPSLIEGSAPEVAVVTPAGRSHAEVADEVADLNDRQDLKPENPKPET